MITEMPELTGHRRFRAIGHDWGYHGGVPIIALEVAVSVFSHAQNKWTVEWRLAEPEDLTAAETIVGLPKKVR